MTDALRLALASPHAIDYLVMWNCRHIAAARVRRQTAGINTREGFSIPILCTPEELTHLYPFTPEIGFFRGNVFRKSFVFSGGIPPKPL